MAGILASTQEMTLLETTSRAFRLIVVLAIAAGAHTASAEPKTIKIGVIQPMSGSLSAYAQEGEPVFEYMIKKINDHGGIKSMGGARIELIVGDDASQPSRTAAEARRLASQHGVAMIMGSILSAQMLALCPVLDEMKVPALSLWGAGSRSRWLYSIGFPYDRGYAATMAEFVDWLNREQGFKLRNAAMVYSNYEGGQQINRFLRERLKAKGFNVVGEVPLDVKAQDHAAAVMRLRALKPDFTIGLVLARDGQLLLKARHDLNYHEAIFVGGTSGFADTSLWRELGPEVGGSVLPRNLFAMTPFSPDARLPAVTAIMKELEGARLLKTEIGQNAIQAAQAARVIQRVLELAGSTDPEKILAAFRQVNIPAGDPDLYQVKAEGLSFGDDRLPKDGRTMIVQWRPDHRQDVVYPPQFATSAPRPFQR